MPVNACLCIVSKNPEVVHVVVAFFRVSVRQGFENVHPHPGECCRCITEPEVHYIRLENSARGLEASFPLVSFCDLDVVVPPPNIELAEQFLPSHLVMDDRDNR